MRIAGGCSKKYVFSRSVTEAQRQAEIQRQVEAERQIEAQRQAEFERQAEFARQSSLESAQKRGQLIEEHIALVESQIRETEKAVNAGTASSKELYQLKKELLALKERLADHQHSVNLYKLHN